MKWKDLLGRDDVLILDTETTGLGERAEIIEIAVIDTTGKERFQSFCKPQRRIPKSATKINKITNDMVASAKKWRDIHGTVDKLIRQANYVLAWNADFDERMLRQTAERFHLRWKAKIRFHDLLRDYRRLRPDKVHHSLEDACRHEGIPSDKKKAHRAQADCFSVLDVMRAYVKNEL